MLKHWMAQPRGEVSNLVDDTRVVALHVLCAAGFGARHDFHEGVRRPGEGHRMSHREALMVILGNFITVMMIAPWEGFFNKIAPLCTARIGKCLLALREFRQYTEEAISAERKLLSQGMEVGDTPNLIRSLVRTSDEARGRGIQSVGGMSDEEIRGNVFIFNLAGHDTTANTLAYAFLLLALHPGVQEWVGEEVDEVMGEGEGAYEEVHPRLKRVLSVMVSLLLSPCLYIDASAGKCRYIYMYILTNTPSSKPSASTAPPHKSPAAHPSPPSSPSQTLLPTLPLPSSSPSPLPPP